MWLRSHYRACAHLSRTIVQRISAPEQMCRCHTRCMPRSAQRQRSPAARSTSTAARRRPRPATSRPRCCTRRPSSTTPTTPPRPRWPRNSGTSRATVSRLLAEAKRQGIVRIEVVPPAEARTGDLADRLARALGLTTVYLSLPLPNPGPGRAIVDVMGGALAPAVGRALGEAGLLPGDVLLVSSGRTVYEVAQFELDSAARRASSHRPSAATTSPRSGTRPTRSPGWSPTGSAAGRTTCSRPPCPASTCTRRCCNDPSIQRVLHLWPQRPLRADGRRRAAADAFGHPAIRADRVDVAARGRRRRVLAVLRPRRRPGRLRGRRPADRRGTRSAAPHSGDDRRRRRQGEGRVHHRRAPAAATSTSLVTDPGPPPTILASPALQSPEEESP